MIYSPKYKETYQISIYVNLPFIAINTGNKDICRGLVLCYLKGTNCALFLADLFLYFYENEFLDKLIKEGKRKLARKFNLSYRYTDDLISFNNTRFKEFISDIYPK